jgi:cold shock protein
MEPPERAVLRNKLTNHLKKMASEDRARGPAAMPAVGASEDRMAARTTAKIIISCAVTGGIHTPYAGRRELASRIVIPVRLPYIVFVPDFALSCLLPARGNSQANAKVGRAERRVAGLMTLTSVLLRGASEVATGTVKFFNMSKGFGFIQPVDGGNDVFVHISAVERAGMSSLVEGQKVSYDVVSERGKLAASNLQRA